MDLFAATLHALAPPFLIILIGYVLKLLRVLHVAHVPVMNGLVMNVTMPALVLVQLAGGPALSLKSFLLPGCLIITELILIGVCMLAGRLSGLSARQRGSVILASAFGNTGYLGYPITLALVPRQFSTGVLIDQFAMGLPMYTIAAFIGARYGAAAHPPEQVAAPVIGRSAASLSGGHSSLATAPPPEIRHPAPTQGGLRASIIRVLRSPLFIALGTGLALRLIPWPHALLAMHSVHETLDVAARSLTTLGQGTTALVLLALGVSLRPSLKARVAPFAISLVLKLFASPIILWALARAAGARGELLEVAVLMAAMPTAAVSAVLSSQYDMDGDLAVGIVCVSTILSALTVPLMLSILR